MRIPFVTRWMNNTPCEWWEWFFCPLVVPLMYVLGTIALILVCIFVYPFYIVWALSIPVLFVVGFFQLLSEKRIRSRLAAIGRTIEWAEIVLKLSAGEGTLIVEYLYIKGGPIREWWTDDNIMAKAPLSLPTSVETVIAVESRELLRTFARECMLNYTNLDSGTAKSTQVRTELKLTDKYPASRIVTLLHRDLDNNPVLFAGEVHNFF